jgi:hypothetical protein
MGATNTALRLAASIGALQGAAPEFLPAIDLPFGGVLLALPALLSCGLLKEVSQFFRLPKGYYGLESIFLLLALMALARIKTVEDLRYCAPGEWGKLLGLDRIPEVRTLREKIKCLSQEGQANEWSAMLCKEWMMSDTEAAATLYIDGHVRVYHGNQTKLPRHYVSRERLCLRATVDYWVNAMDGQPFFVINKEIDPGLLNVLENEIVPRLQQDIPTTVTDEALKADPWLQTFTIIFDREGYSPAFMKRMKEMRIACIGYHKYPKADWPIDEFKACSIKSVGGNSVELQLAERGTELMKGFWVREVRKLSHSGHQTAILSTDYRSDLSQVTLKMTSRWCQENYFKYMAEHYDLDRLSDYAVEPIPDTKEVVNPAYRHVDSQVRRYNAELSRAFAEFGAIHLDDDIEPEQIEHYQQMKADLHDKIVGLQKILDEAKKTRKSTAHHVPLGTLPEEQQFRRLSTKTKPLIDTIKMVAYRAETAMLSLIREKMSRNNDGRSLLRSIYQNEIDLFPDQKDMTLTVCLHHCANSAADVAAQHLCDELNETKTIFPGTNLRMVYKLGTLQNP